jgi:hypothetical protein
MAIKCDNIFHCKTLQNSPKLDGFGLKINHLATPDVNINNLITQTMSLCKPGQSQSTQSKTVFRAYELVKGLSIWTVFNKLVSAIIYKKNRNYLG